VIYATHRGVKLKKRKEKGKETFGPDILNFLLDW
jgi:hypothetical protein